MTKKYLSDLRKAKQEIERLTNLRDNLEQVNQSLVNRLINQPEYEEVKEQKRIYEEWEKTSEQLIQAQEQYNVSIQESLYYESKTLTTLTKVLIGLTAFLVLTTIVDALSKFL